MFNENEVKVVFIGDAGPLFKEADRAKERLQSTFSGFTNAPNNVNFSKNITEPYVKASNEVKNITGSISQFLNEEEKKRAAEVARIQAETTRQANQQARFRSEITQRTIKSEEDAERMLNRHKKMFANEQLQDLRRVEAERLRSQAGSGIAGGLGLPIGIAATIAAVTAASVAGSKAILDYSSRLEQAKIGFETMSGSAITAQKHLDDLQKFAAKTPFKFDELVLASQKMQGVGIEAARVIPILTDVGNSLAAAGRLSELPFAIKALTDIQAKGKLAGQEIIQLANAGIPIRDVLAKQLGVTTAEVIDLGEKGKISSEMVFQALNQMSTSRFGDAMVKQSRTFSGAMSNISDQLYMLGSKAFEPFYKQISELTVKASDEIEKNEDGFANIGVIIAQYIAKGLGAGLTEVAKNIIPTIFTVMKNDLEGGTVFLSVGEGIGESVLRSFGVAESTLQQTAKTRKRSIFSYFFGEDEFNGGQVVTDGVVKVFDTITMTVKDIVQETDKIPSLGEKFQADKAKTDLTALNLELNKMAQDRISMELEYARAVADSNKDKLASIRESAQAEEAAIQKRIALTRKSYNIEMDALSIADREGAKGSALRRELLSQEAQATHDLEMLKVNTRKAEQEEIDRAKEKVKQLGEQYKKVFTDLSLQTNSDNPFVKVFSDAQLSLEKLREDLKGLPLDMQEAAMASQRAFNARQLFAAQIDNAMASFDLREMAKNYRNPFNEQQAQQNRSRWENRFLFESPEYMSRMRDEFEARQRDTSDPISWGQTSFEDFIKKDLQRRSANLFDSPERRARQRLDEQVTALNRLSPTDEAQRALLEQRILRLGSSIDPNNLSGDQRNMMAGLADRAAEREERRFQEAMGYEKEKLAVLYRLDKHLEIANAKAQKGDLRAVENMLRVTIKDETNRASIETRGSQDDVAMRYEAYR